MDCETCPFDRLKKINIFAYNTGTTAADIISVLTAEELEEIFGSTLESMLQAGREMVKEGSLRVWWIRNCPNTPEFFPVKSVDEAVEKLFELEMKDLADESLDSNAGGLERYERGGDGFEWCEWDDEEGNSVDDKER